MTTPSAERCLTLIRQSLSSKEMDHEGAQFDANRCHTVTILGNSGDLATKKIYPALWSLYRDMLIPKKTTFIGFSRTEMDMEQLEERCLPYMEVSNQEMNVLTSFWNNNFYVQGQYDSAADFQKLNQVICASEAGISNRIFYLALPPFVYESAATGIKSFCMAPTGWTRIIIEKPFGRDLRTSKILANHLRSSFFEHELYRIDHYLGKEMVQNLMVLRFGNRIFSPIWNRDNIASVKICFKEIIGIRQRGEYFDEYGILRDVMQNHLMQILTLVAMEKPTSCQPDEIRDEKVKVMKCIAPIDIKETVLGQYQGDPSANGEACIGYLDNPTVPNNSVTPTYAATVLHINNERWDGVPFIMKCGKACDERKTEVRIQFKNVAGDIFDHNATRNELVIRIQPDEAIYVKMMVKTPGIGIRMEETELDLTYGKRFANIKLPDAYVRLLLDVFCGSQMHFVRTDELMESWRIFTPLLHRIEEESIKPIPYRFGSSGPKEADGLEKKNDYVYRDELYMPMH